jgi:ATP phosphoribosyltransferase
MRSDIRLALPSKGRLQQSTLDFLARCGFAVKQSASRGYVATIPALPNVTVLFQRPRDIVTSVANGGVDFGITGLDVMAEANVDDRARVIHDALGYGKCKLVMAVPEAWQDVQEMADLRAKAAAMPRPLRVATVFPVLTDRFLRQHGVTPFEVIDAEGSLEVLPEIGAADMICDLVETGNTLAQNRLRMLGDGVILHTQSALIANREALTRPDAMVVAVELIEYFEAHQRAEGYFLIWANVRGKSFEDVGRLVAERTTLGGLQGPTIAPIFPNPHSAEANPDAHWFSVSVAVSRDELTDAIEQLRAIGGSGVIVTPTVYIFEEQPSRVAALRDLNGSLADKRTNG